jgi:hypothetical protein
MRTRRSTLITFLAVISLLAFVFVGIVITLGTNAQNKFGEVASQVSVNPGSGGSPPPGGDPEPPEDQIAKAVPPGDVPKEAPKHETPKDEPKPVAKDEPPAPSPPPSEDPRSLRADAVDELANANIAYNAPTKIQLDETRIIQLKLSRSETQEALKGAIAEPGEKQGAQIRVSRLMEAHLEGSGFKIEQLGSDRPQLVEPSGVNEWAWEITATDPGKHRLHLTINAVITVDGNPTNHLIRTFDRTIEVEVGFGKHIARFFGEHWQWLWAVLVVPLSGVAIARLRRKRSGSWFAKRLSGGSANGG